jgi:hypothetical protein
MNGTWYEEMINHREKSVVADMNWYSLQDFLLQGINKGRKYALRILMVL